MVELANFISRCLGGGLQDGIRVNSGPGVINFFTLKVQRKHLLGKWILYNFKKF